MEIILLKSFLPEFFLSACILTQLLFNIKVINNTKYNFPIVDREVFYQTMFILFGLFLLYFNLKIEGFFSNFLFVNDESTRVIKILILLVCLFTLNIVIQAFSLQALNFFEFFVIFLLSLLSLLLMVSSSDLISFYLIIEMQALCFYILASFKRKSSFSTEAGLKYFLSGAFISGFFLFGCTLVYGCLGTLNFNSLTLLLSFPFDSFNEEFKYVLLTGVLFITSTLLFKIACAPFHFWAPDVYEGSALSSTVIFSIIPKISLVFFFIKWLCCLDLLYLDIKNVLIFCGILSAFLGTFYGLSQKRMKRLIIYSSIAQVGFIVAGLSVNSLDGFTFVLFFLVVYMITSILIWAHFVLLYSFQNMINTFYKRFSSPLYISSLSNFFNRNKLWALSFVIIFFSIGGIPPLVGFISKIFILFSNINSNNPLNILAAVLLIIISSISVFYYIRIIKIMFFEPKISEKSYEKFQIVFYTTYLDNIYVCVSILLLFLICLFCFPTSLSLMCQYIVLHMIAF